MRPGIFDFLKTFHIYDWILTTFLEVQQSVVPFLKAFRRNRSGVPLFSSINHMYGWFKLRIFSFSFHEVNYCFRGTCNSCGSEIEKPLINNEDLTDLKEALLSKVILKVIHILYLKTIKSCFFKYILKFRMTFIKQLA